MTEQEEDEELLTDLNQGKKNMVVFDESPAYIKVRLQFTVYLLLSKVHFSDFFEGQHYLRKIYIN